MRIAIATLAALLMFSTLGRACPSEVFEESRCLCLDYDHPSPEDASWIEAATTLDTGNNEPAEVDSATSFDWRDAATAYYYWLATGLFVVALWLSVRLSWPRRGTPRRFR